MAPDKFSEQAYLKRRAQTLIIGLQDRLDEIYAADFPTDSPKLVIDILYKVLSKLSLEITNSTDSDYLSLACQLAQSFSQYLEFLDNPNTEQTPRGLVYILEDLLSSLNPDARLLAWPQAEYNYSIVDIIPILKSSVTHAFSKRVCDEIFRECPSSLNLISFPRIERDNILVHSVFGHELGHTIADSFLNDYELGNDFRDGLKAAADVVELEYKTELAKLSGVELTNAKHRYIATLIKLHRRGIQELLSDYVAALIFGPSALFASYDVLQPDGFDHIPAEPSYYPPSRMRLRNINQLLIDEGYWDALTGFSEEDLPQGVKEFIAKFSVHMSDIASITADEDAINNDPVLKAAYEWVKSTLPNALEYAKRETSNVCYNTGLVTLEIPELLKRLYLGVPPNELGVHPKQKAANWRSAILSAWLYQLAGSRIEGQRIIHLTENEIKRTHSLTLSAIEYIILSSKYTQYMRSQGI